MIVVAAGIDVEIDSVASCTEGLGPLVVCPVDLVYLSVAGDAASVTGNFPWTG